MNYQGLWEPKELPELHIALFEQNNEWKGLAIVSGTPVRMALIDVFFSATDAVLTFDNPPISGRFMGHVTQDATTLIGKLEFKYGDKEFHQEVTMSRVIRPTQ